MNIAASLNNTATKYNKDILLMPFLVLKDELQGVITVRSNIKNEELLPSFDADVEFRPHDGNVNVQNGLSLGGRKIKVYVGDVVLEESAEALRNTFMSEGIDNQSSEHPLNMQIIGSIQGSVGEKLILHLFDAVRDANGNTTADLFDGFDTIAAAEKVANKISVANKNYVDLTGSVTTNANAIDKLKAYYAGWTPQLKKAKGVVVNVSQTFKDMLNENIQADQPYAFAGKTFDEILTMLIGWREDVKLVAHVGKSASNWMQACQPRIMICGTDKEADLNSVRVREVDNPFKTQFVMKGCFGAEYANLNGKLICFAELDLFS